MRRALRNYLCLFFLFFFECNSSNNLDSELNELWGFYETLQLKALQFNSLNGSWQDSFGDSAFYGLAFYARGASVYNRSDYFAISEQARNYDLSVIAAANADVLWFLDHAEEAIMAALGLLEYLSQWGDDFNILPELNTLIEIINGLLAGFGDYLNIDMESYALQTYGATTLTGAMALLNLQYAYYLQNELSQSRIERAIQIVDAINANAFDGSRYLIKPGDTRLELYPNTMMMLVLCRLYALTQNADSLQTAQNLYQAIQPLKDPVKGNYRSPYSAESMGAQTEDYSTLSSQNYLSLALSSLFEITADDRYLNEALSILSFIRNYLYDPQQGKLLHHWMDNRIAQPTDLEYFCAGCNLQFLYVIWYLKERVLPENPD